MLCIPATSRFKLHPFLASGNRRCPWTPWTRQPILSPYKACLDGSRWIFFPSLRIIGTSKLDILRTLLYPCYTGSGPLPLEGPRSLGFINLPSLKLTFSHPETNIFAPKKMLVSKSGISGKNQGGFHFQGRTVSFRKGRIKTNKIQKGACKGPIFKGKTCC